MAGQQVFQEKKKLPTEMENKPVSSSNHQMLYWVQIATDFHGPPCEISSPLKNKSSTFQVSGSVVHLLRSI